LGYAYVSFLLSKWKDLTELFQKIQL